MLNARTTSAVSRFLEAMNAASQQTGIWLDVETGTLSASQVDLGYLVNPLVSTDGQDTTGYRFTDSGRED